MRSLVSDFQDLNAQSGLEALICLPSHEAVHGNVHCGQYTHNVRLNFWAPIDLVSLQIVAKSFVGFVFL